MATIDTLEIEFTAKKTDKALQNIKDMATAVTQLADSLKTLESTKLGEFAAGMGELKNSAPNVAQARNMTNFADALTKISNAVSGFNGGTVASDLANMSQAAQGVKATSGIKETTNAVKELGAEVKTATANLEQMGGNSTPSVGQGGITTMVAELDKVASRTDAIKQKFKGFIIPTKGFKSLEEQADKVARKYDELRDKMQNALNSGEVTADSSKYQKWAANLEGLRNEYDRLIQKQKELALAGGGFKFNPTAVETVKAFGKGFTQVTNIIRSGFNAAMRGATNLVKSFASHAKSAATSLKKTATSGFKASDMVKKLAKEILRLSKMLKLMITRMALRAVIKEVGDGFKSLALHSQEFDQNMSNLINSSKTLGYSISSMAGQLLNALAPVLMAIIELVTKAVNALNQLFSAFRGLSTWQKAKDFTGSWSDSIKAANKNAKELKKTVLGFDELNQLTDKTTSGGDTSGNIVDMFEDVPIDPKWKEFMEWLKDMWDMGDFSGLGKLWGEKLRDYLESIPWDLIRETSNKLGKSLATLINGFVEVERLANDIGYTIAQGVNTVFEFINGFVHNLHWDSIGKFIGELFNGFFENIDWVLIKDTVVTGMAGIATAVQTFIETFHWDNISDFIINGIDTIVSGVRAFIEGIKWGELGQKIGEQIRKSIEGINWRNIGETLGEIIQSAIDFVAGMMEQLPSVKTLIEKATDFVQGMFDKVDSEKLGAVLAGILNNLYDFLVGFWTENGDAIKAEVAKFFKGFWDNIDKENLKNVIGKIIEAAAIGGIIYALGAFLKSYLAAKFAALIAQAAGASTVTGAATAAGTSLGTALLAGFSGAFLAIGLIEVIKTAFEDVKRYKEALGVDSLWDALFDGSDEMKAKKRAYAETKGSNPYKDSDKVSSGGHSFQVYRDELEKTSKATQELTTYTKDLSKQASDSGAQFKEFSDKFNGYNTVAKHSIDNSKYLGTEFQNLNTQTKNLKTGSEESTKSISSFMAQVQKTGTEATTATASVGKMTTSMSEFGKGTTEMSKTAAQSFGVVKTEAKTVTDNIPQEFTKAQKSVTGSMQTVSKDTSQSMGEVNKSISTFMAESNKSVSTNMTDINKSVSTNMGDSEKSVSTYMSEISKSVSSNMGAVKQDVDTSMKDVNKSLDSVKGAMSEDQWTFSGVADGLRKTFESAKDAIKSVWNSIADKLNGEHDIADGKMKINLPKFASGGFPENGLFMANSHELVGGFSNGRTAVANNAQIVAGIESGVYNAVSRAMLSNGGNDKYIVTEISVDSEKLATAVSKGQSKANRRYSPSMV